MGIPPYSPESRREHFISPVLTALATPSGAGTRRGLESGSKRKEENLTIELLGPAYQDQEF